jgi:hypothetical protein
VQCASVVHKHCLVVLFEGESSAWHALYRVLEMKAMQCAQVMSIFPGFLAVAVSWGLIISSFLLLFVFMFSSRS